MMRSLFSGVAGLKNHQTRMDVTGNNIANVNTVGYKAGRTTFQDMLSQNIKGAAAPTGNIGGVNPLQVGLGMGVASVDNIFTTGSLQNTGKNTDLAIDGDGFFIVQNGLETFYTRAGNFDFDTVGNYVVPGTGLQVMGWNAVDGVIQKNQLVPLQIPLSTAMKPKVTDEATLIGNLYNAAVGISAAATPDKQEPRDVPIDVYDQMGTKYDVIITFLRDDTATPPSEEWGYTVKIWDKNVDPAVEITPTLGGTGTIHFNPDGTFDTAFAANDPIEFTPNSGAPGMSIAVDFSRMTQYGNDSDAGLKEQNGYPAGTLKRATLTVDSSGVIFGQFTNGQLMNLGQVILAKFTNPGGLTKVGSSLFAKSNNSGEPITGVAGGEGYGAVMPSTLEMSNVDLSEEFTAMITTQRGFQANSRIITTSDSMLEELVNLKR